MPTDTTMRSRARLTPGVDVVAQTCAALSDPIRLRILALLQQGEVCVCDIHGSLEVPQPTASRHLAYLRRHGLVVGRKDGLWVHYRLAEDLPPMLQRAVDAVVHCVRHAPETRDDGRQLARATGRPVTLAPSPAAGCCAPRGRSAT